MGGVWLPPKWIVCICGRFICVVTECISLRSSRAAEIGCATKMFFKAALLELFGLHHFSHAMYVFSRWRVAIYVGGVYFLKLHVCSVAVVCCAVAFCVSH